MAKKENETKMPTYPEMCLNELELYLRILTDVLLDFLDGIDCDDEDEAHAQKAIYEVALKTRRAFDEFKLTQKLD